MLCHSAICDRGICGTPGSAAVVVAYPGDVRRPPRRAIDASPDARPLLARAPRRGIDARPAPPQDR